MLKKRPRKRQLNSPFKSEEYPQRETSSAYPDIPIATDAGRLLLRKLMPLTALFLLLFTSSVQAQYATEDQGAIATFVDLFEISNVGNLHVYAPLDKPAEEDYYFKGERIPRGLYGTFAQNWRNDLPADFEAFALYAIRNGTEDAYLIRFAGRGTNNMIGLFRIEGEKVVFVKTLANHFCNEQNCWQMDSWIQDVDGDTRLDILQKARMLEYTLMDAPVSEYNQLLLQTKDGQYQAAEGMNISWSSYDFADSQ